MQRSALLFNCITHEVRQLPNGRGEVEYSAKPMSLIFITFIGVAGSLGIRFAILAEIDSDWVVEALVCSNSGSIKNDISSFILISFLISSWWL
ncbi:hypothetical protein MKR81_26735 (plasmid) [Vibrio campbellii]|uniref:hypothetical protein n=1 Tax=Vibrio campbellii TaxID=680 RepID=UPI001F0794B8|nr:hypothetical protein [Vibrio campbellii]UMM06861.1 hypothetical protein MKR81_26735 [Vibrio campbellii]